MSTAQAVTITHAGKRYRVEREDGLQDDTIVERFPGIGLVGSYRAWRGHDWSKSATWFAAVNPTCGAGEATAYAEFSSRRASIRWLIDQQ